MLPAILAVDIEGFGKRKDKIKYKLIKSNEEKVIEHFNSPYYFKLENVEGTVIGVNADESVFWMYRVK